MNDKEFFNQFKYDPEKDLLGSGGFGSVYRAYDKQEKRYVAIKISQVKDIFGKFTLLNEVELSKSIDDHTNVARYEFGLRVIHPFPVDYAVMAYYEEGNLDMLLRKRNGQFSEREFYEIVDGLLEGIKHLHNENIIHRDLKLANILMHRTKQGQWRPKIADFGLSRQMEGYDASVSNSAIGITVAYAAPEQIENKPIRRNVDLWAFGVILYRLLTGEMPFAATSGVDATSANLEISRKITQVELPQKLALIPEPYQTMIKRCWVKDTKDRAQEASDLLEILKSKKWEFNINNTHSSTTNSSYTQSPTVETSARVAPLSHHLEDLPAVQSEPSVDKIKDEISPRLTLNATLSDSEPKITRDATVFENPTGSPFDKTPSTPKDVVEDTFVDKPSGSTFDKTPSTPKAVVEETIVEKPSGFSFDRTPFTPKSIDETVVELPSIRRNTIPTPSVPSADSGETIIDKPSEGKWDGLSMSSPLQHDQTAIDKPSQTKKEITVSQTPKASNNKQRMIIGGALLCFLLGFGIYKFMPKSADNSTAIAVPPQPSVPMPVPAPIPQNPTVKNPPVPAPKPNKPDYKIKSGTPTLPEPVPYNPPPTYTPSQPRKTYDPLPPMDDPSTGGRNATQKVEKRGDPNLVKQVNILGSLGNCTNCLDKCETCSEDFTKGGNITITGFTIKADGKMSTSLDPILTIRNHKGEVSTNANLKKRVLEIMIKDFKWDTSPDEIRYIKSLTIGF
jgi:serine/threonine protein kinase